MVGSMTSARAAGFAVTLLLLACGGTPASSHTTSTQEPAAGGSTASDVPNSNTPTTPPAEAGVEPGGRLEGIVAAHNTVRQRHCAPPLAWSAELAAFAQDWANQLRDRSCAFEHRAGNRYGENLSFLSPVGLGNPESIVGSWYGEVEKYDFGKPGFSFEAGHFTQVVWKSTTQLGCGIAECDNAELWVCNYAPAGNVEGSFDSQVLPMSCK
jgi:uncharacterized protein YkwD